MVTYKGGPCQITAGLGVGCFETRKPVPESNGDSSLCSEPFVCHSEPFALSYPESFVCHPERSEGSQDKLREGSRTAQGKLCEESQDKLREGSLAK